MTKPRCPYCNTQGLEHLKIHPLKGPVAVIYCGQCGAIYNVVAYPQPNGPKAKEPDPVEQPAVQQTETQNDAPERDTPRENELPKSKIVVAEIGQADLSQKTPYSPEKMANRAKAAGLGRGTQYLKFAIDDGPPACSRHKQDMITLTLPPGYQNSGVVVWVCPDRDCDQWELADEDSP